MTGRAQGTAAEALSNIGVIVGFYTDTHGSNYGYTFTPQPGRPSPGGGTAPQKAGPCAPAHCPGCAGRANGGA